MINRISDIRYMVSIFFIAAVLTVAGSYGSAKLNTIYLDKNSFYGDTSSYYYMQNAVYADVMKSGKLKALKNEVRTNGRNPLKIIPLIILAPELLTSTNGHLYPGAVMLFCMLFMLGYTVYKRTGSFLWALVSLFSFFLADNFLHPVKGFAANYPDLHAAYMAGAAMFALINSDYGKKNNWYWLFGIFAALTALSRFVAAGYLFFICAPVLVWFLVVRFRDDRSVKNLLISILKAGLPIILIAGYYFYEFTYQNLRFYSVAGYALNNELIRVLKDFVRLYKLYMGTTGYGVLAIFCTFYSFLFWKERANLKSLVVTIWLAISQLIFIIFILKVGDDWLTFLYALPGFLLLMLAPFELKKSEELNRRIIDNKLFGIVIILVVTWIGVQHYSSVKRQIIYPAPDAIAELDFQRKITRVLLGKSNRYFKSDDYKRVPVFDTFFYEYGRSVVNESFMRHKKVIQWTSLYSVHPGGWKVAYPGKTKEEISKEIYERVKKELDFVFIISNPGNPKASGIFNNDISMTVVKDTFRKLSEDTQLWKHEALNGSVKGLKGPWGEFHLFRNMKRTGGIDNSRLMEYAYRITSETELSEVQKGNKFRIDLKLLNTSSVNWLPSSMSGIHGFYYWLDSSGNKSDLKGFRFEKEIKAGESCEFVIDMDAPEVKGEYELVFSMVHEDHAFFDNHGNKPYRQKIKIK